MLTAVFIILIIAGLAGIVVIVTRRLPDLASVDVETIAERRHKALKEDILVRRLSGKVKRFLGRGLKILRPLEWKIRNKFRDLYRKVLDMEREYKINQVKREEGETGEVKTDELLKKANNFVDSGNFIQAERLFIDLVKLDNKNLAAYQGLSDLYARQRDFDHAKEICQYILKVDPKNSDTLAQLSEICKMNSELKEALSYGQKALKEEPNSPKFLDNLLEISIILKDKIKAKETYQKLKKINPDNKKLAEFRKRINAVKVARVRKKTKNEEEES